MSSNHGQFVWYELMTTDAAAAEAFYRHVAGWGAKDAGMPGMAYTLLSVGETTVAGLMTLPAAASEAGARPGWVGYVAVEDVDATAAQAVQEGGAIRHGPEDIPGVGRFAVLTDPQGAGFALFKSAEFTPGPALAPWTPGKFDWHELYAGELESAAAFYTKLFGWTKSEAFDMGPLGTYQIFGGTGQGVGMMTKPVEVPAPFWKYYINVADIDAAVARVQDAGGKIFHGPQQVPGGAWIVQGLDPQDVIFALVGQRPNQA